MESNLDFLKRIVLNADRDYTLRKTAEECMELATVLLQSVNKPTKIYDRDIEEEISHVTMRIMMISEIFNKDNIQIQFDRKVNNMKKWEIEKGYKNL